MKISIKKISCCLFFILAFSMVAVAQSRKEIDEMNTFQYAEGIHFTIRVAECSRTFSGSQIRTSVADKGFNYVSLMVDFTNETQQDTDMDFSDFSILDQEGKKYSIILAMRSMKIHTNNNNYTHTLKAGKTVRFVLAFNPYPKNVPLAQLVKGEQLFPLANVRTVRLF